MKPWSLLGAITIFVLLILLGCWQIKRYHENQRLLHQYQLAMSQPSIAFAQLKSHQDIHFQRVSVTGHYLNEHTLLIQNRFYQGKPGFEVLTPFQIEKKEIPLNPPFSKGEVRGEIPLSPNFSKGEASVLNSASVLLINRGWVPTNHPLTPIVGLQHLQGLIQAIEHPGFILGVNIISPTAQPLILQKIDIPELIQLTQLPLYPFVLHLDPNDPSSFLNDWRPVTVLPQRNLGYAIQWFTMALVFSIAVGFFCRAKT